MTRALTTKQRRFVENYVTKGLPISESVRRAGYLFKSDRTEDYGSYGCKLLKQDRISSYVSKLREKAFSREALSYAEKRAFLARAVRTSIGEIHEGSDLAQEVTITEGKEGTSRKVKAVDKLRAIELDSKLAGDFYADRTPQASNPFLMIVSLGKNAGPAQLVGETQAVSHPPKLSDTSNVIEAEIVEQSPTE
jgi:phage terminase small subunit